jgi:hypothetical protein
MISYPNSQVNRSISCRYNEHGLGIYKNTPKTILSFLTKQKDKKKKKYCKKYSLNKKEKEVIIRN